MAAIRERLLTRSYKYGTNNTHEVVMAKRRAGRPEVAASQKREQIIRFVVTKAEEAKIRGEAKRRGLSVSQYLRNAAIPRE
jgi:hypothetical protein